MGDELPERILLFPSPGTATRQEVLDLDDRQDRLCQLVDGTLVEKARGSYESILAALLGAELNVFLASHPLGVVLGADGVLEILPDQVRIPDVSFIAWDKFPLRKLPRDPLLGIAPDLAVKILSPDNTPREMQRKLREYLASGARLVWFIDPQTQTAEVYTAPGSANKIENKRTGIIWTGRAGLGRVRLN